MCRRLIGKVAVITASSTGIGYAIAERFAQEGAKVVISSRSKQNVADAVSKLRAKQLEAYGVVCHVRKPEERERLLAETVKHYGGIDIVVPNAGAVAEYDNVLDTPERQYDEMFNINVKSTFFLIKEAVTHMAKRSGGAIIIIGSVRGYDCDPPVSIYGITKTALLGMTKALVPQLTSLNIRVNFVAPGVTRTDFSSPIWKNENILKTVMTKVPMVRIAEPHEIGSVAAFLASEDASYITGETIVVGGGLNCHL